MKTYRAKIVHVEHQTFGDDREDRLQAYITPISLSNTFDIPKPAQLPNFIPQSSAGSGVFSTPEPGQECIVTEDVNTGEAYILSYVVPPGIDAFGDYIESNLPEEGGILFKIGGFENSILKLERSGIIAIESNQFCRLNLNGNLKRIEMAFKTSRRSWYSGAEVFNCDDSDNTDYIFAFGKKYEYPGQSDWENHDVETSIGVPAQTYVDKAVIKIGAARTYELQTRQTTGDSGEKDTISALKLGYISSGNILDWRFKRNVAGHVGTMVIKYGEEETGELWNHSILHGLNGNKAYGMPIFDSCGEGLGYSYDEMTDQVLVESYGRVGNGSIYRRLLRDKTIGVKVEDNIGGDSIYGRRITVGDFFLNDVLNIDDWIVTDSNINVLTFYKTGIEISHDVDSGIKLESVASKLWRKNGILLIDDSSIALSYNDNDGLFISDSTIFIKNATGDSANFESRNIDIKTGGSSSSNVHVDDEKLVLRLGGFSITVDGESITLEGGTPPSKIILSSTSITLQSAAGHTLEIGPAGLTFNGSSLIYASLLDWLNQYAAMIGMGNMGAPVPLFPTTLSAFQIKNAIPAIPGTVLGFRT